MKKRYGVVTHKIRRKSNGAFTLLTTQHRETQNLKNIRVTTHHPSSARRRRKVNNISFPVSIYQSPRDFSSYLITIYDVWVDGSVPHI